MGAGGAALIPFRPFIIRSREDHASFASLSHDDRVDC
jgi:hypothetical protein